jgi:hypothetical protein
MADPSVRFYDAQTRLLLAELDGDFRPEGSLQIAARLRRSSTHYKGAREQSTQVLGVEEEPIPLEGRLDDTFAGGTVGRAKMYADALMAAFRRARPVDLEVGEVRRYGFIDECQLEEEAEGAYTYAVSFLPTAIPGAKTVAWVPTPWRPSVLDLDALLNDVSDTRSLLDRWRELRDRVMGAWQQLNPMRLELLEYVYAAENALFLAAEMAGGALGIAGAARETVQRIASLGDAARASYGSLVDRARGLSTPLEDDETLDDIRDQVVVADVVGQARLSQARILQMIRAVLEQLFGRETGREHVVRATDTLPRLAIEYYGDADEWRRIYEANRLQSTTLAVGQRLRIPE